MNKPQVFDHSMFGQLPVIIVDGVEWFGATEAATSLSFSNPHKAIDNHVEEDDCTVHTVIDSLGRKQPKKYINESGLYSLIFGAAKQGNNPEIKERAKTFKRWVTSDVLPTIRKHGMFATDQLLDNPDFAIEVFQKLKEERAARIQLESKYEEVKPLVHFAQSIQISDDLILVSDLATLLKQKGVDTGERRLFEWLRDNGYLIKSGSEKNMPTQRSLDLKIFEVKTGTRQGSDGTVRITRTAKVTGKGQVYFINKFIDQTA